MNKCIKYYKKVLIMIVIIIVLVLENFNIIHAKEQVLNINDACDLALQNSSALKILQLNIEHLQLIVDQANEASRLADQRLKINDRFLELYNAKQNNDLTDPNDIQEYNNYVSMYGKPIIGEDQKFQFIQMKSITPLEAKYSVYSAQNNIKINENAIKYSVMQSYCNLLNLKDSIEINNMNLKIKEENYKTAQLKLKYNLISSIDYKKIENDYTKAKISLDTLNNNYNLQLKTFNRQLGLPINNIIFSIVDVEFDPKIDSIDNYLEDALINRIEIKNATQNSKNKKYIYDIVYDSFSDEDNSHIQNALYEKNQAEHDLEDNKINIQIEIKTSYQDIQKKLLDYKLAQDSYNNSLKKYNEGLTQYKINKISNIDLKSLELSLKQAEIQINSIKRDIWLRMKKLEFLSHEGLNTSQVNIGGSK